MSSAFPHLFSPIRLGSYTIKNRIMNTGHAAHFQTGDGLPTARYVDYLRERAKGGVGIIVTGHTVPHADGDAALSFANFDERIVPMSRERVARILSALSKGEADALMASLVRLQASATTFDDIGPDID